MEMNGQIIRHVGGLTIVADTVAVEEIVADGTGDFYYRFTECTDDGICQSTWPAFKTPVTILKLIERLEAGGSHVGVDGTLVGPHLMRKSKNRQILSMASAPFAKTMFLSEENGNIDLGWLDSLLHITEDIQGIPDANHGDANGALDLMRSWGSEEEDEEDYRHNEGGDDGGDNGDEDEGDDVVRIKRQLSYASLD